MNTYPKKLELIEKLSDQFQEEMNMFPEHNRLASISLLANSIIEVSNFYSSSTLTSFKAAISHIALQKDLKNYLSMNAEQRLCVDIFSVNEIAKQEHHVVSQKHYIDTLRIYEAEVNSSETKGKSLSSTSIAGFTTGFVSIVEILRQLVLQLVSPKTGENHDK